MNRRNLTLVVDRDEVAALAVKRYLFGPVPRAQTETQRLEDLAKIGGVLLVGGELHKPTPLTTARSGMAGRVSAETFGLRPLIVMSMGAGAGCDGQYLFATDVLGSNRGHYPRHSKTYRNFAAEFERLQNERVNAFREFSADIASGAYPEDRHVAGVDGTILAELISALENRHLRANRKEED